MLVMVSEQGLECLIPALTLSTPVDALVPASHFPVTVVARVSAPGVRHLPRFPGPRGGQ